MNKEIYITKEGLEKLKKELQGLKTVRRPEIISRIQRAKELGDLSENAEYQEAKDDQGFTEGRILELQDSINNALIINGENQQKSDLVQIGSTITVSGDDQKQKFTIVGSKEANPAQGKISNESPLGEAFLGRRVGDELKIKVPRGVVKYKILGLD